MCTLLGAIFCRLGRNMSYRNSSGFHFSRCVLIIKRRRWSLPACTMSEWHVIHVQIAYGWCLQGASKRLFPGCENVGWKNCVLLPAVGKQNATFSPNFTQPGKRSLEVPCRCGGPKTWKIKLGFTKYTQIRKLYLQIGMHFLLINSNLRLVNAKKRKIKYGIHNLEPPWENKWSG